MSSPYAPIWPADIDDDTTLPDQDLTGPVFPHADCANKLRDVLLDIEGKIGSKLLDSGSARNIVNYAAKSADLPPAVPSAYDCEMRSPAEFNSCFMWIRGGAPSGQEPPPNDWFYETWGVSGGRLRVTLIRDNGNLLTGGHYASRACPGVPWSAWSKLRFFPIGSATCCGVWADDGTDNNVMIIRRIWYSGVIIGVCMDWYEGGWTNYQYKRYGGAEYLKLQWDGSQFIGWFSPGGCGWARVGYHTPGGGGWTPARFGLLFATVCSVADPGERQFTAKFFRVSTP